MFRRRTIVAGLAVCAAGAWAQEPPCGLRTVTETIPLVYPAIARAAHVSGVVIVRATFTPQGAVSGAEVWVGPEMLRANSLAFVKGWHVNTYGGSRSCPIVIRFQLDETPPTDVRSDQLAFVVKGTIDDPQHYSVVGRTVGINDPEVTITRRRHLLGIF